MGFNAIEKVLRSMGARNELWFLLA